MTQDRPFLGILLMLGFCVLAPLGDSIAKLLGDRVPLGMLLLTRFGIQFLILLPIVLFTKRHLWVSSRIFWLTLWRSILHIIGIGAMFTSLKFLPLADAVAIAFVMPFIMLLLGKVFLKELVGPHRLIACAIGFIGTLLVVQPNFAEVGAPALLPLIVAVDFALFMLVTRQIAKDVDPISLQTTSGAMACVLIAPLLYFGPTVPALAWIEPTLGDLWLLIPLGVLGTLAHLLMTWSLRYAPSATLAPMQYLEIPIATLIGFAIFRDWPNGLAALGIAITIGAGLYIVFRERSISLRAPAPQ
jgi:drug/metabolite transporter (DMT)-like permease